jgi:hypothetical protein
MALPTFFAAIKNSAVFSRAAIDNGGNHLTMLPGHMGIFFQVFRAEGSEDLSKSSHGYTSFISKSMM